MQKLEDVAIHLKEVDKRVGKIDDFPYVQVNHIFDEEIVSFVKELSSAIRLNKYCKQYPDVMSFAFWCRQSNLKAIRERFSGESRLGRGLCFHIAPSNVPITFAFSFIFSLLAGNSNIVRLPSLRFSQTEMLLEIIDNLFQKYPDIEKSNLFCSFDKSNVEASSSFSECSDCRVIWGGDSTIEQFKNLKTKPRCVDICFSDRYSFAVIDAIAVANLSEEALARLAENFVNDSYTMNQNACSSPHFIAWLNDDEKARNRFWSAVISVLDKKIQFSGSTSFEKYNNFCECAVNLNIQEFTQYKNLLYRMELKALSSGLESYRCRDGAFFECSISDISELFKVVNEKFQTLTYFGIDPKTIYYSMSKFNSLGIDRIVPFGKALDMTSIWDGFDVIRDLSRIVYIE